jgi:HK97 family phage portal protein
MKLFGFEITKAADNKATAALMPNWSLGAEHVMPKDYESMVNAYRSWVYICANKNSITVAQQNLRLYVAKPSPGTKLLSSHKAISAQTRKHLDSLHTVKRLKAVRQAEDIVEITDHPFLDLMQNVNNFTNQFDLWELTTVFQELTGNAYWYVLKNEMVGVPEQLWVMPSQNMRIIPDKYNFIRGYVYTCGTVKVPFDIDEIIHFKYANPNDQFYGMSPLEAATDAYNTNQNIATFSNSLFTNMARPEGTLSTSQDLDEDDFERLKVEWKTAYGGAAKARKTAVLAKGLKYVPITMTPQELDFKDSRVTVKEEIMNAFGQTLGMYSEKSNRANSEQAYRSFLRDTITPRLRRIEEKLNEQVMQLYDQQLFVAYDSAVPEDVEQALLERESNLKTGLSAINEERTKLGKDPVSWGNVPLLSTSMAPLGTVPPKEDEKKNDKFIARRLLEAMKRVG